MEQKTENKQALTKVNGNEEKRVSITANEAIEYREYKRQRKRAEILSAIANSEGILTNFEDEKKVRERAMRLRQAAVCMTPKRLEMLGEVFRQNAVAIDCVIGGNGETLTKVKAYEARTAVRMKAREVTLMLSPYLVLNCQYAEIEKEVRRVRRAAGKTTLKVRVDRVYTPGILSRLARLCAEIGVAYFCVPYFEGCERLRLDLKGGCKLQVFEVEGLETFKKLHAAGVERIVTTQAWEMYSEWMKEVEKINFPELMAKTENPILPQKTEKGTEDKKPAIGALCLPLCAPQKRIAEGIARRVSEEGKFAIEEERKLS